MTGTGEHYFSSEQTSEEFIREVKIRFQGRNINLLTSTGMFSPTRLDKGTEVFLNKMVLPDSGDILDLGCGYGAIGIIAALKKPRTRVLLVDVNKRAVKYARKNVKRAGVRSNASVRLSDLFEKVSEEFNAILCNPPFSAGKKVTFKMIQESFDHLKNNGTIQMVARTQKGGKSLSQEMKRVFGNVEKIGGGSGYSVYLSKKNLKEEK